MEEFIEACKNGHVDVVRVLLSNTQVDPSRYGNCAIRRASEHGHKEVVRLLLSDTRVDPSSWCNAAIRWAAYKGHLDVIRLLLTDNRVLRGYQKTFEHPNIQKILEEYRSKKAAIIWCGETIRKEWRYLCPIIVEEIAY